MYGEEQISFLRTKNYLVEGETLEDRIESIVNVVRKHEYKYSEGLANRIKSMIENQILSLSTPQWANMGRESEGKTTPLPVSCNIISYPDSIAGIYYSHGEAGMLSKLGAGVGASFLNVSNKHTELEEGFYSNPKLDWIEDFVGTTQKVSQGSKRRGYGVPFISIDDPEFYDMMKRIDKTNPDKHDPLVENNVGIVLPVGFVERVKNGDKEAQKRILLVLEERKETGKVYLVNLENMNKNSSKVYEILGHFVDSTNICCVTGDQLVPTEFGYKTVEELSDCKKELNLFDNEDVYKSSQMLYRGYANVYKVELENGMSHKITSNHDLVVRDSNRKKYKKSIDNGLKIGDKVCFQTEKGLFGKRNEPKIAFLAGLYMGDGTKTSKNSIRLSLWENDFDLIEEVEKTCKDFYNRDYIIKHKNSKLPVFKKGFSGDSNIKRLDIDTSIFNTNGFEFEKDIIPHWILDSDEETQWQFLRGLLYADGTAGEYNKGKSFGNPITVSLASIREDLLNKLQIVFANMGLNFKKHILRSSSKMMLPKNDGTNNYGEYVTKPIYRLILSNKNDLIELENKTKFLSRKDINIEKKKFRDNSKKSSKIINITKEGKEHVYCPTVDSEKHLWICNGIITSNTEVITPSYDDKTFACVIASLNAVKWDIIKENPQMIIDAYMFLDIVVEEYIELTEGIPFLEKARRSAIEKRDIGLGLLGFHELLQMNNLSFGGLGSKMLNIEIFSTMREYGEIATKQMAEKLGSPKMCEEAGLVRRNVSLMMVAPNKSTSFICGNTTPGIEPNRSNTFLKALAGIQTVVKNKYLKKKLQELEKDTPEVWDSIVENIGSVQHLDFLDDDTKAVFKTASEISPKDIINLASDRQQYIDMSQSLNLFNRPNYTLKDIYDIHMYAFERDIKTLYYFYPQVHSAFERDGDKWDTCESCAD